MNAGLSVIRENPLNKQRSAIRRSAIYETYDYYPKMADPGPGGHGQRLYHSRYRSSELLDGNLAGRVSGPGQCRVEADPDRPDPADQYPDPGAVHLCHQHLAYFARFLYNQGIRSGRFLAGDAVFDRFIGHKLSAQYFVRNKIVYTFDI